MKILYVTTVSITMGFFPAHFNMLLEEGHTIELACNCEKPLPQSLVDLNLKVHNISFSRSPFSKSNIAAIKQLKKLIEDGHYDIIHTHTPNASACVRFVCRKLRKNGLKVFYTAHGFHFYKGAPLKNWLVYYPVEWLCAHWTDTLITINQEDFELSKKHMHAKNVIYIPGVGINIEKFSNVSVNKAEFLLKNSPVSVSDDDIVLLSVGELIERKNHESVIKALTKIKNRNWKYFICGEGALRNHLESLVQDAGLTDKVVFLGYREDVAKWYAVSNLFVFPSFQEGLPVALMEAIASKKLAICSNVRGNVELISEEFTFHPTDVSEILEKIEFALSSPKDVIVENNYNNLRKFDVFSVNELLKKTYFDKTR